MVAPTAMNVKWSSPPRPPPPRLSFYETIRLGREIELYKLEARLKVSEDSDRILRQAEESYQRLDRHDYDLCKLPKWVRIYIAAESITWCESLLKSTPPDSRTKIDALRLRIREAHSDYLMLTGHVFSDSHYKKLKKFNDIKDRILMIAYVISFFIVYSVSLSIVFGPPGTTKRIFNQTLRPVLQFVLPGLVDGNENQVQPVPQKQTPEEIQSPTPENGKPINQKVNQKIDQKPVNHHKEFQLSDQRAHRVVRNLERAISQRNTQTDQLRKWRSRRLGSG